MDITQQLIRIAKKMHIQFTLHNKPCSLEEVFTDTGMLPAIIRRADQLASFCLGTGLSVSFDEFSQGRLGVRVRFEPHVPPSLIVLCATEILQELLDASPQRGQIALDDLLYD